MTPDLWGCEGPRGIVRKKALCPPSGQHPHPGLTFLALGSSCALFTTCSRQEAVVLGAGGLGVPEAAVATPPAPGRLCFSGEGFIGEEAEAQMGHTPAQVSQHRSGRNGALTRLQL